MSVASKRNFRAIRNALLVAASAPLAFAAAASAETAATDGTVRFGTWGVDLKSRDLKANPGDDFERYASGTWMDVTEIPADKPQNGVGSEVNDRNQERLHRFPCVVLAGAASLESQKHGAISRAAQTRMIGIQHLSRGNRRRRKTLARISRHRKTNAGFFCAFSVPGNQQTGVDGD